MNRDDRLHDDGYAPDGEATGTDDVPVGWTAGLLRLILPGGTASGFTGPGLHGRIRVCEELPRRPCPAECAEIGHEWYGDARR